MCLQPKLVALGQPVAGSTSGHLVASEQEHAVDEVPPTCSAIARRSRRLEKPGLHSHIEPALQNDYQRWTMEEPCDSNLQLPLAYSQDAL